METKEELVNKMAEALEKQVPDGASFGFSQPIELRVAELISGVRSDIAIKIFGDDLDMLKKSADQVAAVVNKVPGAEDVKPATASDQARPRRDCALWAQCRRRE
jgi:cobalt-zinc-cadmium resistance protein CzcA